MASKAKKLQQPCMTVAEMEDAAILQRGGHCIECVHKVEFKTTFPNRFRAKITPATIAVRVSCSLDSGRSKPFQGTGVCSAIKRHNHQQQLMMSEVS
jgi:hypothetical protein